MDCMHCSERLSAIVRFTLTIPTNIYGGGRSCFAKFPKKLYGCLSLIFGHFLISIPVLFLFDQGQRGPRRLQEVERWSRRSALGLGGRYGTPCLINSNDNMAFCLSWLLFFLL